LNPRKVNHLRESFWVVPAALVLMLLAGAVVTTALDDLLDLHELGSEPFGYSGDAEAARTFLVTIAGSIIAVAGVSYSITIAVLALTSMQFGPRLIRNFVRDLSNQAVLGVFLGTFAYCLVVLRSIRGPEGQEFIPFLSVLAASLLALASLGLFIYFIGHVARSIQAMQVIAVIGNELAEAIVELFPERTTSADMPQPSEAELAAFQVAMTRIGARRSGYIQGIDFERLVTTSASSSRLLCVRSQPPTTTPSPQWPASTGWEHRYDCSPAVDSPRPITATGSNACASSPRPRPSRAPSTLPSTFCASTAPRPRRWRCA
jgi:uncharacterized membrane protein